MAKNRVIGSNGKMPWHIPDDLKNFKTVTMGAPLLMGRKTYQSIGSPLPGRTNIVLTRNTDFLAEGIETTHDISSAIQKLLDLTKDSKITEGFIIGGAEIYKVFLNQITKMYITEVDIEVPGDTHFPTFNKKNWKEISRNDHKANNQTKTPAFSFTTLEKKI